MKRLAIAAIAIAIASPALSKVPTTSPEASIGDVAVTHRTIALRDGKRLSYSTRAGFLPLIDDATRAVTAHVYFVAYTADRPAGAGPRPITFIFPGGPGAPATLSKSAPRVVTVSEGQARIADNPDTLLASTDMVLIDPVGTGYSRMTKAEYAPLFYDFKGDIDSLTEVVRLYLQRYDPAESPLFLSGGSYGSIRSILVADAAKKRGIPIQGIMISAEGASMSLVGSDAYHGFLVPGFAIVAHAHNKLPADLQADRGKAIAAAKAWAAERYLPALFKGNALPADERHRIATEMARYSGLTPEFIEANNLKVSAEAFTNELLRAEGKSVGFYDTRITGPRQEGAYDATRDPSLRASANAYPSLAERHLLNRELGMRSDNYYAGPFGGGWPVREGVSDWMSVKWGMGLDQEPIGIGVEIVLPTFVRLVSGGLHALIGQGYYDWASPAFGVDYVAARVPPAAADRVVVEHYESGHAVPAADFARDSGRFIATVLQAPHGHSGHSSDDD